MQKGRWIVTRTSEIAPPSPSSLVMFSVDQRRYAVPLAAVERILPAEKAKPVRGPMHKIVGLVNLPDRSIPVLSLRRHLGLKERKIAPSDRLLIIRSNERSLALVAEEIEEDLKIHSDSPEHLPASASKAFNISGLRSKGLLVLSADLHLIVDLDLLLDDDEETRFEKALRRRRRRFKPVTRRPEKLPQLTEQEGELAVH